MSLNVGFSVDFLLLPMYRLDLRNEISNQHFLMCIELLLISQSVSSIPDYGKCSKLSNTSCLPKCPRKTVQTDQTASEGAV